MTRRRVHDRREVRNGPQRRRYAHASAHSRGTREHEKPHTMQLAQNVGCTNVGRVSGQDDGAYATARDEIQRGEHGRQIFTHVDHDMAAAGRRRQETRDIGDLQLADLLSLHERMIRSFRL